MSKNKDWYLKRVDVSYCVISAETAEEALNISGLCSHPAYVCDWEIEVGETMIELDRDD
jgi:hypothetical protein